MSVLYKKIPNCGRLLFQSFHKDIQNITRCVGTASPQKSSFGLMKLSAVGLGLGTLIGTGYSIHLQNKTTTHLTSQQSIIPVFKEIPQIVPSRRVVYPGDQSGLKLTLFQYQTCPFCCKVRAFLDYFGVSYDVVEVNAVLKQSIKWSPYKKVPILVSKCDDGYQPLNDSSMIISALHSYLIDTKSTPNVMKDLAVCYPSITFEDEDGKKKTDIMNKYFIMFNHLDPGRTKEDMEDERKWRRWVDEVFIHTLAPNVYRTKEEALQTFNWFSQAGDWENLFPGWERWIMINVGATAMWLIAKRLKKKYNLKDEVRLSLYDESNYWMKAINKRGGKFMGGNKPNLSDISMYGVLNSIEGCDAFKDLMNNSKIKRWYYSMRDAVKNHKGSNFA